MRYAAAIFFNKARVVIADLELIARGIPRPSN
jgi:hypothetical protein